MTEVADEHARRRIAEDHGSTLFVEAGAGSGKTSSLVSRVVTLVVQGVDVASIAAITFTEAAAAELRARVRRELEEVESGGRVRWVTDTPEARQRAAQALDRLDRATICTLHAFAQRLLLAAPVEARLPPAIEVHDDISSALRAADRWQRFERSLLDDDDLADVMRMALTLAIPSEHLRAIADTLGQNWDLVEEADLAGLVAEDLAVGIDPSVLDVPGWAARLDALAARRTSCSEPGDTLLGWLDDTVVPLHDALLAAGDDPYELVLVAGAEHARPHNGLGRKDCWDDGAKAEVIRDGRALLEDMAAAVAEVKHQVLTRLGAEIARHTLADAEARRREGRLEFHDLLVLARQVLRTKRSVRERFHHRFTHLLIDEFQDTDPIQVELAVRIAAAPDHDPTVPWDQVHVDPGRLFFVGDPKQSIYRFRRADIDLFTRTADRYAEGATGLRVNFRTVEPVLRFCNAVFDELIRHEVEALDEHTVRTAQPAYVPLEPHRPALADDPGPPVLVLGDGTPHQRAADARDAEAGDVARALVRAHEEGWLVQGEDDAEPRPCHWSDMAVLLPSRTTLAHLRSRLDELGVPYRLESGTLVYGTTEVTDLLAVLRAIDDPGDAIALVGALRSPAYACGDDDLFRWTQQHGRVTYLGAAVRPDDELADLPPDDVPVVEGALADLRRRHREAPFQGVAEVVESVIRDRRLMELCLAGGRHRDLWRLYRLVVEHARQFADTEDGGLRSFLRWAEMQRDDRLRALSPVIPEADVDAVRILTIHGAKGLEFGITAVSGLSARDPSGRTGPNVQFRPDGGFEIRTRKGMETTRYEAVRTLEETMDLHERIRLLYVALTRARDHLVVSSHHTRSAARASHGGRIAERLAALGEDLHDIAQRWTAAGDDAPAVAVPGGPAVAAPPPSAAAWQRSVADLARRREAIASGGGVLSATAIAGRLRGADPAGPGFREDDIGVTPADAPPWRRGRSGTSIGSAVHAVLQHADLADPAGADVADLARWQAAVEGLAEHQVPVIEAKARAALASPLLARATAARWCRRELHVSVPLDALAGAPVAGDIDLVEGFIDLVFDDGDGLVVVDHKTDEVASDAAVEAALERYAAQGATYALLLEAATGRAVTEVHFLFLRGADAVDATVPDLPAAVAEVRGLLSELATSVQHEAAP
jgi:ATP-dependent helicase/nuclease subunit A